MPGRPRLKPARGWCFRVIVCNKDGQIAYEDTEALTAVQGIAGELANQLHMKKLNRR